MRIKIKICCISSESEAKLAVATGADALGLVGPMPSGPGVIGNDQIAEINLIAHPPVETFLLTSETSAAGVIQHHRKVNTSTIQMVDSLTEGSYHQIKSALPGVKLVQVVHVVGESTIETAIALAPKVDALLLDSGNPNLLVKELGGTGRTHNWALSHRIVKAVGVPVYLAGGLQPSNVKEAIRKVRPFGVDVCSGVRTDGQLDQEKLSAFVKAVRSEDKQ